MNEFETPGADEAESVEAQRLADALDAVEAGQPSTLSATEDPQLGALLETATLLRASLHHATDTASFHSYQARSRAFVLHSLEQRRATQSVAARAAVRTDGEIVVPFVRRHRRWAVFAPLATAAAALALFFFTSNASAPSGPVLSAAVGANQTAASTEADLARMQQALAAVADRSAHGQPIDAVLLRTITESTSAVANKIDTEPQTVSKDHVATYQRAVATGNAVLNAAQPAAGSEDALAAAQRATQDGVVTAARYLGEAEPTVTAVAAAATATPAETATVTPTPTPTPAATPRPTSTATPTATPSPVPTQTATATPTSKPGPTATSTATPTATAGGTPAASQ